MVSRKMVEYHTVVNAR